MRSLIALGLLATVAAYPNGAPRCVLRFVCPCACPWSEWGGGIWRPGHPGLRRGSAQVKLLFSDSCYVKGQPLTLTVTSDGPFHGFVIKVAPRLLKGDGSRERGALGRREHHPEFSRRAATTSSPRAPRSA